MDSFITRLKSEAEKFFSSEKTLSSTEQKTLDDVAKTHTMLINKITSDIINFFMENKNKDEYILELLDPSVCNDVTLYLTQSLNDQYTPHAITKFQDSISVSKSKHKPCTTRDSCTKQIKDTVISSDPPATKWDLCYAVASHYVKMLNLLGALLIGISPEKNMCMERINSLYKIVKQPDGTQGFEINICRTTGKKTVKDRVAEENGMRELINLYILEHMDKLATDADFKEMDVEYKKLIKMVNGLLTKKITGHPLQNEPTSLIKITIPITTEQTDTNLTLKTVEPTESLVDKIKVFDDQIKLIETKSKSQVTPMPQAMKNEIQKLKTASEELTNLMTVRRITPDSVKNIVSRYPSSSYQSQTSDYSSTTSSNESESQDDLIIYINDAYNTLSKIRNNSTSESSSMSSSSEMNTESSSSYNSSSSESSENEDLTGGAFDNKDDSIAKFFNFIKKYKEHWTPEVRKYFDELINNSFITGPVSEVCATANVGNKDIFIDTIDIYEVQTLQDFLDNFNDMRSTYIDYCDKIVDIVENDLLETVKEKRNTNYKFRNLSSDDLNDLQKKGRKLLLEMYTENHTYYIKGLVILKRYFTSSFYKKAQASNKK